MKTGKNASETLVFALGEQGFGIPIGEIEMVEAISSANSAAEPIHTALGFAGDHLYEAPRVVRVKKNQNRIFAIDRIAGIFPLPMDQVLPVPKVFRPFTPAIRGAVYWPECPLPDKLILMLDLQQLPS